MDRARIDAYFSAPERRGELISALSRLVAVKSVKGEPCPGSPFGPGPRAALDEALKLCSEWGFAVRDYDGYVGLCDLNEKETQLHILGHLDVVGEGTGWDSDPYTCVERDGMLYGRGVSDDKGPVCAALLAMKAVRELGLPVSKNVRLILGTDEESGSSDIAYYYAREPYAPQAFTPDAEFPLINVEKGHYHPDFGARWDKTEQVARVSAFTGGLRLNVVPPQAQALVAGLTVEEIKPFLSQAGERTGAEFSLEGATEGTYVRCIGRNAHAASPEEGLNAISALLELLAGLPLAQCGSTQAVRAMARLFPFGDTWGRALGIAQADEVSGELTVNLALLNLDETGFQAKFDARVPLCATRENCAQVCEAALAREGIGVTGDREMTAVHMVEADSPLVRTLLGCYEACTGEENARPLAIGGGTYVHEIPGGVAFGCNFPGFDSRMHGANEHVKVDDLLLSARIFTLAIAQLCR